jgi:hypothetical protein
MTTEIQPKALGTQAVGRSGPDFQFKVQTVKWFGMLSALVILLMIGLGFWYLNRIVELSQAYQSTLDFASVLENPEPNPTIVTLGLEHDGLAMRNKRGVGALYMRAYSQFLAIISGTVLALLGAVFILARVDSVQTQAEGSWGNAKWLLTSASPGVITTFIGAMLIGGVVYVSRSTISVTDAPVFLNRVGASPDSAEMVRQRMASPEFAERMRQAREADKRSNPPDARE